MFGGVKYIDTGCCIFCIILEHELQLLCINYDIHIEGYRDINKGALMLGLTIQTNIANIAVAGLAKQQGSTAVSRAEREARYIWNYLQSNYSFRDDNIFFASLDVVDQIGSFDCDDFARVGYEHLTKKGIEAKVLAIKIPAERNEKNKFHVICVYKDKGKWRWMDNTTFGGGVFDSYMQIPTWYYEKKVYFSEFNMREIVNAPVSSEDQYDASRDTWGLSQ